MKRIGIIDQLYARPLFQRLISPATGMSPPSEIVHSRHVGTAELAVKLRQRKLDGAFLSPIDYAKNYSMYRIVPSIGIVSQGGVGAVDLVFNESLRAIQTLAVDASASSEIVLANLILREKYDLAPQIVPMSDSLDRSLEKADAVLLVADAARNVSEKSCRIDLVGEWNDMTGLPYVHGFWVEREDSLAPSEMKLLLQSAEYVPTYLRQELPRTDLDYLERFEYRLSDEAISSLTEVFRMAYYYGILKDIPEVKFHSFDGGKSPSATTFR